MEKKIDKSYMTQIQKYPLLSADQEADLSKKIQTGDKNALSRLINSNLRLVVSCAHKFSATRLSMMDLIQEGNIGLMVAAQKFQSSFKTRFSTYAYPWIIQYMLRYANTRVSFIALPHRKDDMLRQIQNATQYLFQQTGHDPSYKQIADFLGITEEKLIDYMSYAYQISSLDTETSDEENSSTIVDFMADSTYCPEQIFLKKEEKEDIRNLMENLPSNEKNVLWYRYNFDGSTHTKTLREISKIVGVSPEAVRQTEIRAIKHMRLAVTKERKMQLA